MHTIVTGRPELCHILQSHQLIFTRLCASNATYLLIDGILIDEDICECFEVHRISLIPICIEKAPAVENVSDSELAFDHAGIQMIRR